MFDLGTGFDKLKKRKYVARLPSLSSSALLWGILTSKTTLYKVVISISLSLFDIIIGNSKFL